MKSVLSSFREISGLFFLRVLRFVLFVFLYILLLRFLPPYQFGLFCVVSTYLYVIYFLQQEFTAVYIDYKNKEGKVFCLQLLVSLISAIFMTGVFLIVGLSSFIVFIFLQALFGNFLIFLLSRKLSLNTKEGFSDSGKIMIIQEAFYFVFSIPFIIAKNIYGILTVLLFSSLVPLLIYRELPSRIEVPSKREIKDFLSLLSAKISSDTSKLLFPFFEATIFYKILSPEDLGNIYLNFRLLSPIEQIIKQTTGLTSQVKASIKSYKEIMNYLVISLGIGAIMMIGVLFLKYIGFFKYMFPNYKVYTPVLLMIGIGFILSGLSSVLVQILVFERKTKWILFSSLVSIVFFIGISVLGGTIYSASSGFLISNIIYFLLIFVGIKVKF